MPRKDFFSKFASKLDAMDPASINSYIHLLAREHGFLESVFNSIKEGIVVIDSSFRLVYHNAVAKEMFGIPDRFEHIRISHLVKGISWNDLVSPDRENPSSACHEVEILYPRRRILKFYVAPRPDPDPEQRYATLIFNDITDMYDRMHSAAESERTQLVSMLAAEVAHEIGNPLNSLYLNLQLFQRMLAKGELDLAEASEMIGESRKEVERLDSIIHQFLQAIRPSKPEMHVIDVKNVLLESLTFMRHEIEGRNVSVNCLWSETLPKIRGDANQLKQAFYNLIKVQAMPQGGSLTISCSCDDRYVFIVVADKGRGIRPEDAVRLFKPFFTTKEKGNGLGLMVVERVIREHGGRLSFESKVGKGTKFTIALPRLGARIRVLPPPPGSAGILPEPAGKEKQSPHTEKKG